MNNLIKLDTIKWQKILGKFSDQVSKKGPKKIEYCTWRWLKGIKNVKVFTDKDKIYVIDEDSDNDSFKEFSQNDDSFGQFLTSFLRERKMDTNKLNSNDIRSGTYTLNITDVKAYDPTTGKEILNYTPKTYLDNCIAAPIPAGLYSASTGTVSCNINGNLSNVMNRKEKKNMKMFNGFDFGKVDGSMVHMSMYGLAVKNASGTWVSYDAKNKEVIDVEVFNFDGNQFLYKIPVALDAVEVGDMIVHAHKPVYVTAINDDKSLNVIDIVDGEIKTVLPTKNMFNFNFVTKVISIMDMMGNNKPDAENPFGNMWMLALMDNSTTSNKDVMMMMALSGKMDMKNPMMMYALMSDNKDIDPMMLMLMSGTFSPAT